MLQDRQRRFWQVNSAGEVVCTNSAYTLQYSPDGWMDTVVKNVRNRKYWGLDRSVSLPFKFVEDGAKILKYIFTTRGVEEPVYLVICEQRLAYDPGVSYGYWYKQIYRGEIDLSTYLHEGPVVTVNTLEDGLVKHLKANENTEYEFDLDEYVKMDGVVLKNRFTAITDEGYSADGAYYFGNHIIGLNVTSVEFASVGSGRTVSRTKVANSNSAILATGERFLDCTVATDITIDYDFRIVVEYTPSSPAINPLAEFLVVVRRIDPTGFSDLQEILLQRDTTAGIPGTYDLAGSFTMPIREGDKLFLYAFCTVQGASGDAQIRCTYPVTDSTIFRASYDYRQATSYVRCTSPQTLFAEFINRMTAGEYTAETCPYLVTHANKKITSGDAIRGIEDATLKLSFSSFFEFFDCYDAVGVREKAGQVLMARKADLIDTGTLINLGEVGRPKITLDKGFAFNELAIGYPDVKSENGMLNGRNEVNTTFVFSFGTTKTPAKLSKVSKIKASCYDIENTRIEGANRDTTSRNTDNDVYVVHTGNTLVPADGDTPAHYELNRDYNTGVTGVEQVDSVFNLALSPGNCLRNGGDWYRSCLWKYESKTLKFIKADRNKAMQTSAIVEDADVPFGDLADPFFTPVLLTVEADSLDDLLDNLDSTPEAVFQFTFEGRTYKGISVENSVNPKTYKKQTFTLLSHPDNDLTPLIDYYG